MASIDSVRARHLSLHLSPHAAHALRRLATLALTAGIVAAVALRAGALVPGLDGWIRHLNQTGVYLGIVVLTLAAIAVAVKAASDFQEQHEEHDIR